MGLNNFDFDSVDLLNLFPKEDPYRIACAQRLLYSFQQITELNEETADFYVALRAWLSVDSTPLQLPEFLRQQEMIKRFRLTELQDHYYSISNKYPEYIQSAFTNRVFQHEKSTNVPENRYVIRTSPYVYQQTGYQYYKSTSQQLAVDGAVQLPAGYTALICMPTGSGKSLVTQSLAFRCKESLTVVIVPTVSLAIDQERAAKKVLQNGNEGGVYSYLGSVNPDHMIRAIQNHTAKLLFISPEAIQLNKTIRNTLYEAAQQKYLMNLVIDEAHMVVEWGSVFRLDYQTLESFRNRLLEKNAGLHTVLLSATYDKKEVAVLKSLFSNDDNKWIEIRCDAMRKEPLFHYISVYNEEEKLDKIKTLVDLLPHPMIIYTRRPVEAESLKDWLKQYGYQALRTFTGDTKAKDRETIINDWAANKFNTMIATSAFGIGVDKKDVRTILHLYVPENPNSYYQEIGRGGRDGYPSLEVMCIYPQNDIKNAKGFSKKVLSEEKLIERWFAMLKNADQYGQKDELRIDTSVLPEYSLNEDEFTGSQRHIDWNVYVLLLLRRYNLIHIIDVVLKEDGKDVYKNIYLVFVKVTEPILLQRCTESEEILKKIRDEEAQYFDENFNAVYSAIENGKYSCWSEMFYSVYNQVDEYCPGCDAHEDIRADKMISGYLPLRNNVRNVYQYDNRKLSMFKGSTNEVYIEADSHFLETAIYIMKLGCRGIVLEENTNEEKQFLNSLQQEPSLKNVHFSIYNAEEFIDLQENNDQYFLNGPYLIIHTKVWKRNNAVLMAAQKVTSNEFWAIHLVHSNYSIGDSGRHISELIDGPHFDENILKRSLGDV